MSYILEALKKAQAERQLGNAPTIHAPPPMYATPDGGQGGKSRSLALGLGVGVLVAAVAAVLWMRQGGEAPVQLASAPAPVAVPAPAPAVVSVTPPPVAPTPAPDPAPAPVSAPAPAAHVAIKPAPAPVKAREPAPAPRPVQQAAPETPAPAAPAAQPGGDDNLRSLQQLPEALQREIPKVTFGGYIYSPTPGESLLLVDKMLRREGEEVAPGLVLERLTARAAVMNYRGTRYRVGY